MENWATIVQEKKDKDAMEERHKSDMDNAQCMEKLKGYESLYARRLKAKYFSKKTPYEGGIFEVETTVDNEIIKSSRWPCTRSFADPSTDGDDSPFNMKTPTKKSC